MKKQEMLDRYSELASNRGVIASASVEALQKLAVNEDSLLDGYELGVIHDSIIDACMRDAENDQKEIANLLTVATSEAIDDKVRAAALERALIMLELDA